jgi:lactoylglutathione lyase
MKTLHTAYRVTDLDRSLDFDTKLGFQELGRISTTADSMLVTLNLPGDGEVATLELVHDAGTDFKLGTGFSHIVVQVDDLVATLSDLASKRVSVEEPQHPAGESGPKTSWVLDPDGYRIELVEWPPGHPDGVTRADFA